MSLGPPNMSSTVQRFSTPGTRRRDAPWSTNADGFRVDGASTDTVGLGHIFPASGDLLQRFSLQDTAGLFEVHTELELRTADREAGTPADQWLAIVRGNLRTFDVVAAGPWLEGPSGANTWTVAALQEVHPS